MGSLIDLVTFGEAMVRLTPPDHERLEQATSFDAHVGGSELNVAVAAARLGLSTRFVTCLTENPLGRRVRNAARENGVDTSCVVWTDRGRVGTYYLECGAAPRSNSVVYDRAHSAMAELRAGEVDWRGALAGTRAFHVSGITPALSASAADATLAALECAIEVGAVVSVDLNYRARLWSPSEARATMTKILQLTNILITTEEDTERVFGIHADSYENVARQLSETFALDIVAITLRETPYIWRNAWTAIAYDRTADVLHRGPRYEIEVVDRVGSGDAFAGGFLYGYLQEGPESGVRYGVAISAIKQTHPGDIVYATKPEVDRMLKGSGLRIDR
jgi:2-dehydro-3-deoxygluconokinase